MSFLVHRHKRKKKKLNSNCHNQRFFEFFSFDCLLHNAHSVVVIYLKADFLVFLKPNSVSTTFRQQCMNFGQKSEWRTDWWQHQNWHSSCHHVFFWRKTRRVMRMKYNTQEKKRERKKNKPKQNSYFSRIVNHFSQKHVEKFYGWNDFNASRSTGKWVKDTKMWRNREMNWIQSMTRTYWYTHKQENKQGEKCEIEKNKRGKIFVDNETNANDGTNIYLFMKRFQVNCMQKSKCVSLPDLSKFESIANVIIRLSYIVYSHTVFFFLPLFLSPIWSLKYNVSLFNV